MRATAALETLWIAEIIFPISTVDVAVLAARLRTSSATTANPLPASPALADSIAAFSPSKLVCFAMPSIKVKTSSVFLELSLVS